MRVSVVWWFQKSESNTQQGDKYLEMGFCYENVVKAYHFKVMARRASASRQSKIDGE